MDSTKCIAIVVEKGIPTEVFCCGSFEDARRYLLEAVADIDHMVCETLREANEIGHNHYSVWERKKDGSRYEDVT